jgi:hypothetical protein
MNAVGGASGRVSVAPILYVGATAARKAAVQSVRTPYLAFMDVDDAPRTDLARRLGCGVPAMMPTWCFARTYACTTGWRGMFRLKDGAAFTLDVQPIAKTEPAFGPPRVFLGSCSARNTFSRTAILPPKTALRWGRGHDSSAAIDMPRIAKVGRPALNRYSIFNQFHVSRLQTELIRLAAMRALHQRLAAMRALPAFLPQSMPSTAAICSITGKIGGLLRSRRINIEWCGVILSALDGTFAALASASVPRRSTLRIGTGP